MDLGRAEAPRPALAEDHIEGQADYPIFSEAPVSLKRLACAHRRPCSPPAETTSVTLGPDAPDPSSPSGEDLCPRRWYVSVAVASAEVGPGFCRRERWTRFARTEATTIELTTERREDLRLLVSGTISLFEGRYIRAFEDASPILRRVLSTLLDGGAERGPLPKP